MLRGGPSQFGCSHESQFRAWIFQEKQLREAGHCDQYIKGYVNSLVPATRQVSKGNLVEESIKTHRPLPRWSIMSKPSAESGKKRQGFRHGVFESDQVDDIRYDDHVDSLKDDRTAAGPWCGAGEE